MKKLTLVALCMLTGTILYAQSTIKGEVRNMEGNPIPYIQILLKQNGRVINGAHTDSLGFYQMLGIEAGTYDVTAGGTVSCVNIYTEKDISVSDSEVKFVNFKIKCVSIHESSSTTFPRHEIKLSVGDAWLFSTIHLYRAKSYLNLSVAYNYRLLKWLWVGGNFVNYFGKTWSFSESKMYYCAVIAPEIRFSFLNTPKVIFYGTLSGGVGLENGYDDGWQKYPNAFFYLQITYFGFSCSLGKNNNFFLGGELGIGHRGLFNFHGGYRF